MIRKLLSLCLAIAGAGVLPSALAQTPGQSGVLDAVNFNQWTVAQGTNGPFAWPTASVCLSATSSGVTFKPFVVGTPIKIVDMASPSNSEVVTVTAVNINGSGCSITTTTPVNQHYGFYLASATAGLQEAINYANQGNIPAVVLATPGWALAGGTTSTIVNAVGNNAVTILDERVSNLVPYTWNGTDYVAGGFGSNTSFAGLTSGQNTTASMIVGTGANLDYTGGGTIDANLVNGMPAPGAGPGFASQFNPGFTTQDSLTPSVAVGLADTVITFPSTTGWPAQGEASWQDSGGEAFTWTGNTGTQLTGVTRGANGTVPANHDTAHFVQGWVSSVALNTQSTPSFIWFNNGWYESGSTVPLANYRIEAPIFAAGGLMSPYAPIFAEQVTVGNIYDPVHGICNPQAETVTSGTTTWYNGVTGPGCMRTPTATVTASTGAATFASLYLPNHIIGNCLIVGAGNQILDTTCGGGGGGGGGNTTSTSLTNGHLSQAVGPNSIADSSLIEGGSTAGLSTPEPFTSASYAGTGAANAAFDLKYTGTAPTPIANGFVGYTQSVPVTSPYRISPAGAGFTGVVKRTLTGGVDQESAAIPGFDFDVAGAAAATRVLAGATEFHSGYYASLVGTPACTIGGTTYTTTADCMSAAADAYNVAQGRDGAATVLFFDTCGVYPINYPITQYWVGYYNSKSKSVVSPTSGCITLQATTHMNAMIQHQTAPQNTSLMLIHGLNLDANFLADSCIVWHTAGESIIDDIFCGNTDFKDDDGNSNIPVDIGNSDTSTTNGDLMLSNIAVGGSGHGSQMYGNTPQVEGVVTAGAMSGYYVFYQANLATVTAQGSGGTPGTYGWSSTGNCRVQPSGSYVIGSGGTINSASINTGPGGYGVACPNQTSPTVVLANGTGLTGGALTLVMDTGAKKIGVPFAGQPAIPIVPVLISHALGEFGGTTMPAVYQNSNPAGTTTTAAGTVSTYSKQKAGMLVTGIPFSYNTDGSLVGGPVPLADNSIASTGAGISTARPVKVWLAVQSSIYQGITLSFPDSTVRFLRSTVGLDSCIAVDGGGSTFIHLHPYDGCQNSIGQYGGGNTYTDTEIDSPHGFGFKIKNGINIIRDAIITFDPKDTWTSAAAFGFVQGGGATQKISGIDSGTADPTTYDTYVGANGPITLGGSFQKGEYDVVSPSSPTTGIAPANILNVPLTGPGGVVTFAPLLNSSVTTQGRNSGFNICANKYINATTPNGGFCWTMITQAIGNTNNFTLTAPGNDPLMTSPTTPYAFILGTAQGATATFSYGGPLWGQKGAVCTHVTGTTCDGANFPTLTWGQNAITTGGVLTAMEFQYSHSTINGIPYDWTFPGYLKTSGVITPGITYAPISYPLAYSSVSATGGTLPAGTYYYCWTALSNYGESVCSPPNLTTTTGSTSSVKVSATPQITNAVGYMLYRCTSTATSTCGLMTPTFITQSGNSSFTDDGSGTPGVAPPQIDDSMAPVSYQPPTSNPFIVSGGTAAAAMTTFYTAGNKKAQYHLKGAVGCNAATASSTAVLTVRYSDVSNTTQTLTATANCASMGTASVAQINQIIRAAPATTMGASVAITGAPTYDASVVVEQDTQF